MNEQPSTPSPPHGSGRPHTAHAKRLRAGSQRATVGRGYSRRSRTGCAPPAAYRSALSLPPEVFELIVVVAEVLLERRRRPLRAGDVHAESESMPQAEP